jgi:predicted dehydrogenase
MKPSKIRRIRIAMNGVTGRMGARQHLVRSILAIIQQGGIPISKGEVLMPEPILVGRNPEKLKKLAEAHGIAETVSDLDKALADCDVYFDAQTTRQRFEAVRRAIRAGKPVYCEKPLASTLQEAKTLVSEARAAKIKNGVVQDKLWLPGIRKLRSLIDSGFFGTILSVRGEFGYWVFDGTQQPAQRPSWNYRKEEGGGIITDMFCHWQYLLNALVGPVRSVSCFGASHIPVRIDEAGKSYTCTAEDAAYATFLCGDGVIAHFNSSWVVRVRRDDLLSVQVDGTKGSAVAGLWQCFVQEASRTPLCVWNPDAGPPKDHDQDWIEVDRDKTYENAFKVQWEIFLKHVAMDEPFPWTFEEGAKGIALAEHARKSWQERRWVDLS